MVKKKESPLKVEIPKAGDDRPAWSKVGIIGVAGFVIGVVWPRLAGVHLGPNPPNDVHSPADSPSSEATAAAADAAADRRRRSRERYAGSASR